MRDDTPVARKRARRSCIFKTQFVREQIDPRVKVEWEQRTGAPAPFGDLRGMWVREHCVRVSPGQGLCPYSEESCAMAFLSAIQTSLTARNNPRGYFRRVAKTMALDRLDSKPLTRELVERPGDARAADHGADEGSGVRRTDRRPVALGDLLRSLDLGSRQGPAEDRRPDPETRANPQAPLQGPKR